MTPLPSDTVEGDPESAMLTCDEYLTPASLDEAFAAMAAHRGRYRIVAGATDTLPWAREGRAGDVHIPVLIDVTKIHELRDISVGDKRVRLGAATPIQRFLDDPRLARRCRQCRAARCGSPTTKSARRPRSAAISSMPRRRPTPHLA